MSDRRVFLDSNVIVYLYSADDPGKAGKASLAITTNDCFTGVDNMNETMTVLYRKYDKTYEELNDIVHEIEQMAVIVLVEPPIVRPSLRIMDRYGFSYYDSLVAALALETGCSRLYTEDLHHGQRVDDKLTVTNIFL